MTRVVTRNSHESHIKPILKSLHWLPVKYRINFKLCCLSLRALSLREPNFLTYSLFQDKIYIIFALLTLIIIGFRFSVKFKMVFAFLLILHHFFATIYLSLFVLYLPTYLLDKPQNIFF